MHIRIPFHLPPLLAPYRADLLAALLEFLGTTLFLLLGLGSIQSATSATLSSPSITPTLPHVMYIATGMGLALLVSAWLFFRATGGLFNPNVSLALLLCGVITPVRFALYTAAQMMGGVAAAAVVLGLTPGQISFNTFLSGEINPAQGVFIEMFVTAALCIAVLMLGAEKHQATPFAPVGVGLTLFSCHLFAVYYTGASMNTARSFGPALISGFPTAHHWVYWVGPALGSLLATAFYTMLKHAQYWHLTPHQDSQDKHKSPDAPLPRFVEKPTPPARPVRRFSDTNASARKESGQTVV